MRKLNGLAALLAVGLLAGPMAAQAALVVDQNNPTSANLSFGFCGTSSNTLCGQSFQQSQANIAGAGVFLTPVGYGSSPGVLTISIYGSYSSSPSQLLASGTSGSVTNQSGWVDVFWSPVAVSPATTYYMVLASSIGSLVPTYSSVGYAAGNALAFGSNYSGYDLTFRTYYENAPVPLPAAAWLLLCGLGGLGFIGRRRKAA